MSPDPEPFVPRVACIGECMVELSLGADAGRDDPPGASAGTGDAGSARVGFAGDTANTAVYLKRSAGPAARVGFVSVVGPDELSRRLRAFLRAEGVDDALVGTHGRRLPGLYAIATDGRGERTFSYWRERSAARTLFEPGSDVRTDAGAPHASHALDALRRMDLVHLSGITLAILSPPARERLCERLARCRERGVRVSFDSNYRPALWEDAPTAALWIGRLWRLADIGLPSADDERALFGDPSAEAIAARLRQSGVVDGVVKDGERGAVPIPTGVDAPPFEPLERMVDSTAAGDSFDGAFLAARLAGRTTADAIAAGHALARVVVCHPGAIVPREATAAAVAAFADGAGAADDGGGAAGDGDDAPTDIARAMSRDPDAGGASG